MNRSAFVIMLSLTLVGCSQQPSGVRITQTIPVAPVAKVVKASPRSEPVFYNGKIYQVGFEPDPTGGYAFTVSGMNAGQQKDAVAVSTSSLRQFACTEKQSGKLLTQPQYTQSQWRMSVHCVKG